MSWNIPFKHKWTLFPIFEVFPYLSFKDDSRRPTLVYSWHLVGVLDYSKEDCQYLVEKVLQKHLPEEHKNSDLPGQFLVFFTKIKQRCCFSYRHWCVCSFSFCCTGVTPLLRGSKHWVPRIRLLFGAEDPRIFVQRIQFAMRSRDNTEELLLYHLTVDGMAVRKETPSLDTHCIQRIKGYVLPTPGLKTKMWAIYLLSSFFPFHYNLFYHRPPLRLDHLNMCSVWRSVLGTWRRR